MRVGELLLERGWIDPLDLKRAIAEQRHTGRRLCSLLIARGLLDPDHASRALAEQHGCVAVLQRHLEIRDRGVVRLLAPKLARACFALPIGRNHEGELVVVLRDPTPETIERVELALPCATVFGVAPATQLEQLIARAYDEAEDQVLGDVELDVTQGSGSFDIDLSSAPRPAPPALAAESLDELPLLEASLVELDDESVTKTEIAHELATGRRPTRSALESSVAPALTLDDTIAALAHAADRDAATALAMGFAARRWSASLLLRIDGARAIGYRGHGAALAPDVVRGFAMPLDASSIVQVAYEGRRIAVARPHGASSIQERLVRVLGQPRAAAAAPVVLGDRVACVLVAGDPIGGGDANRDLERLAAALGVAFTRIAATR
ncbi:MAG TPA: hypothetical protein VFQ53_28215 [Kofleriaceae bacterium]|nr:hypothetical protein [Kofleriaceae bacterium]